MQWLFILKRRREMSANPKPVSLKLRVTSTLLEIDKCKKCFKSVFVNRRYGFVQ